MGLHLPQHMWKSEDNVWAFFPSVMLDLGVEFRVYGYAASIVTR